MHYYLFIIVFAWSGLAFGFAANPAVVPPIGIVQSGSAATIGFGSNGTVLMPSGPVQINNTNGQVRIVGPSTFNNPSGAGVPVSVSGRVSPLSVLGAVSRALIRIGGPLAVGSALYQLYRDLNIQPEYTNQENGGSMPTQVWAYYPGMEANCAASPGMASRPQGTPCLQEPSGYQNQMCLRGNAARYGCQDLTQSTAVLTQQQILDMVADRPAWGAASRVEEIVAQDTIPVQVLDRIVTGPAASPGPVVTTIDSVTGQRTVVTTTNNHTYEGDRITTNQTTNTTVTNNAGNVVSNITVASVAPVQAAPLSQTQAQPATPPASAPQIETCGLPGKPKCQIDETGTPAVDPKNETQAVEDLFRPLKELAQNPTSKLPTLPTISWAFQLPTACSAITISAFAPFLQAVDICPFKPMFHEIMSMVWVIGGLLGAISVFWRNVFAQT